MGDVESAVEEAREFCERVGNDPSLFTQDESIDFWEEVSSFADNWQRSIKNDMEKAGRDAEHGGEG